MGGLLRKVGEAGADLVVTGEDIANLFDAATYLDDRTIFRNLAQETCGDAHQVLPQVARHYQMHIVARFFELEADKIYNSSVLFGRDGHVIGRYHKVHLPVYEGWQVTAGDSFPAFETDLGMVGMLICYDQMWSESAAACALNGARIICHPSAASLSDYQMRTRAQSRKYIASRKRSALSSRREGPLSLAMDGT